MSQKSTIKEIKSFLSSIANPKVSIDDVREKYVCYNHQKHVIINEDFIRTQLNALRDTLKSINPEHITIVPYINLPNDKQNIVLTSDLFRSVYSLVYNEDIFLTIYIKNRRIHSITTLYKGGTGFLVPFCR